MKEEVEQFRMQVQQQDWNPATADAEEHSTQTAVFEVTAITAGIGNGWHFTQEALRASLGLWEGVEVFIDHQQPQTHRSLRDLAGVAYAARYDESWQGVVLKLKLSGPSADGVLEVFRLPRQMEPPLQLDAEGRFRLPSGIADAHPLDLLGRRMQLPLMEAEQTQVVRGLRWTGEGLEIVDR